MSKVQDFDKDLIRGDAHSKQNAFTLVELAIVLVIIGLIVASVLVGKDLIKSAELRAITRQYNEYQTGVGAFIEKYNGIPGDVKGSDYALTGGCDADSEGGDGDGLIEDSGGAKTLHDGEVACFWSNLTTSGKELISGSYDGDEGAAGATVNDVVGENMPQMAFGSEGWGVFFTSTKNYFITGVDGAQADDAYDTVDVFVPIEAYNIDVKIDDGVPTSGTVQSRDGTAGAPDTAASTNAGASTSVCNNTTPSPDEYQYTATDKLCTLRFEMTTY